MKKAGIFLFSALVALLIFSACAGETAEEDSGFQLYYPAASLSDVAGGDAVVTRALVLETAETMQTEEIAEELLTALLAPAPDASVRAPLPNGTTLLSLSIRGSWARVDFSRQYARLAGIDLTLADYCVTLTLTQLEGINAVSITSGGQELPYRSVQALTAADPLMTMKEDALRPITVSLYFRDKESGELKAERQVLALYEGQTRVNALLTALLEGPESGELTALLGEEFSVLSSRVEEGTCYLNLPAGTELGEEPELAMQSLVYSVCSLDNVSAVQIVVDGEIVPSLCGVEIGEPLSA